MSRLDRRSGFNRDGRTVGAKSEAHGRGNTKKARMRKVVAAKVRSQKKRTAVGSRAGNCSTRQRHFRCRQTYHVFQRGNFQRSVFLNDRERAAYLNYFFSRAEVHHVRIHNFCLMKNHIHFVLEQTRRHGISRLMRDLQGLHTRKQNARSGSIGNLWNQHFGCKHVVSDQYYRALMWYVSNNPVQAGVVDAPTKYKWSAAVALTAGGANTLFVRDEKGNPLVVAIRLWMARFNEVCLPASWAQTQAEPLSSSLAEQLQQIELILDGTARVYFANQQRIRRLNEQREARKAATEESLRWQMPSAKAKRRSVGSTEEGTSLPPFSATGEG